MRDADFDRVSVPPLFCGCANEGFRTLAGAAWVPLIASDITKVRRLRVIDAPVVS
jgi:hypothetical protein